MASIGWQDISIAVTAVLIVGCGGLLLFTREFAQQTVVQPKSEPIEHRRIVVHSFPSLHEDASELVDLDTGQDLEATIFLLLVSQAMGEGLTQVSIIEELDPDECGCQPPRYDRAYLLKAHECSAICACVNENDPRISPRVELFPAE
ncbi:MAG: hypothetical protein WC654_02290 [Patescibacteria group bacterium]